MSKNFQQLNDDELDLVSGGNITYTWDGSSGSIGIDGNNAFRLLDKEAFLAYYTSVHGTMTDGDILRNLLAMGVIGKR